MNIATKTAHKRCGRHLQPYRAVVWSLMMVFAGAANGNQGPDATLDNIVVTGTRISDVIEDIPNATTVIGLDEIEARGDSGVMDLLRDLPGVHVVQPSGQGGVSRVFIRGSSQELVMILLDGVRVNDPNDTRGSAFDFSTLNLNDIERIEIVRGPQSAVYGSDAMAGVINIISKGRAEELGGTLLAERGTEDEYRGALELSGPINTSGGFSVRVTTMDDGHPVHGTGFQSDSVSGKLSFAAQDAWNLRVFGRYSDSKGRAFPEDSGGFRLAVLRDTDKRSSEDLDLGVDGGVALNDHWNLNLLATWYDHDSTFFSPGVAPGVRDGVPPNGADANLKRLNLAAHALVDVSESLSAAIGADFYHEDGYSNGFVEFFPGFNIPNAFRFDRKLVGYFTEVHYKHGSGLTLLGSLRRDDSRGESGETTGKLGLLYRFNQERTTVRANWGQGFKLPGFFALSSPLVGNPDLRPEKVESADIGVTQWFVNRTLSGTVTLFRNHYTNMIDFDSTLFKMVNRPGVTIKGVEMGGHYAINDRLSLQAQATYLDISVKANTQPLRQLPDWRGGMSLRWVPAPHWLLDTSWLYVGETFDSSVPTGERILDPYHRVDVTVTYSPAGSLDVVLAIDNVLDNNYDEAIGFPSAGRRGRLGLRIRF